MCRTFVIGDVHGCRVELEELIMKFKLTDKDRVIFVGDLVHKGPDSVGVLALVANLKTYCKVDLVAGNHEEKQLRFIKREIQEIGRAHV